MGRENKQEDQHMKNNVRAINLKGCHPRIAAAIKRGEAIECIVGDSGCKKADEKRAWIYAYTQHEGDGKYIADDGYTWEFAEPVVKKDFRVMPPEFAIPILIAEGYQFDSAGNLRREGGPDVAAGFFKYMGTRYDKACSLISCPLSIIEFIEE